MSDVPHRLQRTRKLCRILSEHVSAASSPGLGRWDEAWEIVEEPSDRFLEAVEKFERTGDEQHMVRAKDLAVEVRDAWKEADRRFRAQSREGRQVPA